MPIEITRKEDVSSWLTARQAIQILNEVFGIDGALSKRTLLQRLRGRQVVAVPYETVSQGDKLAISTFLPVVAEAWEHIDSTDDFWWTGSFEITVTDHESPFRSNKTIRYFDVRFRPVDIEAIVAPHRKANAALPDPQEPEKPTEAEAKKQNVSGADLKAWHKLYVSIYGGTPRDTLTNAVASAKGMFPDRFVSRDKVRELAGGRTPGRRKGATDEAAD